MKQPHDKYEDDCEPLSPLESAYLLGLAAVFLVVMAFGLARLIVLNY